MSWLSILILTSMSATPFSSRIPDPSPIVGGQVADACAFPNVVYLVDEAVTYQCSGTLVHPSIVATAAHCVEADTPVRRVQFGESEDNFTTGLPVEFCRSSPDFINSDNGYDFLNEDYAFCKLVTPVTNVPIIPIAAGCELDDLEQGATVVSVGFGRTSGNGTDHSIKRFAQGTVSEITALGEIEYDPIDCFGDSGGPLLMEIADGTIRQVGIHSYLANFECTGWARSAAATQLIPFVYEETGIDISPCTDPDGAWTPTGSCGGFPLEPHVGGAGDYAEGCRPGPQSEFSSVCGPAIDEQPDEDAPTVAVVTPMQGDRFELDDDTASVTIEATADDATGWGVESVELLIESVEGATATTVLPFAPYATEASFGRGGFYARAIATDHAGNVAQSDWVAFGVGVDAPPPREDEVGSSSGEDDSSGETGDGATSGGTTSDGAEVDDSSGDGCGCRSSQPSAIALLLLIPFFQRRPREGELQRR